jgi:hypothetical protein
LIGLGLPMGWMRLAVTVHPIGMVFVSSDISKDCEFLNEREMNLKSAPVVTLFIGLFKALSLFFLLLFLSTFFDCTWAQSSLTSHSVLWKWIYDLNILIVIPNIFRQAALQLMSNSSHYYFDIPEKSPFYQNQILDHWMFWPFQLLCCNFGTYCSLLTLEFSLMCSVIMDRCDSCAASLCARTSFLHSNIYLPYCKAKFG